MALSVAREQAGHLEEALAALLAVEPYLAYANFEPIARREGALHNLYRRHWQAAAAGLGALVARDSGGRPVACICLEHRDFESCHFGIKVAKIEAPLALADESSRLTALRQLYGEACRLLRSAGYQHLTATASAHDRIASWVLQEIGAFHVGTRISWMQTLHGRPQRHDLASHLHIEVYEHPTASTFDPATWRRLHEWTAEGFDRGPFVFDLHVPRRQAIGIYQTWTEKALTGEWADVLLVVRDGSEIVAFNSMMWLEDLSEAAGVGVLGRGIGASLPGYRGLFTALQKECASARPLGAGFLENEAQSSTVQSIQVFGKLGHRCLRASSSFHMPLDRQPRPACVGGSN